MPINIYTASKKELIDHALEEHGVKIAGNTGDLNVRKKVAELEEVLFDESMLSATEEGDGETEAAPVLDDVDNEDVPKVSVKGSEPMLSGDQAARGERVKIKIFDSNDPAAPRLVQVGLNGRNYVIKRNEVVSVPVGVLDILRNAEEQRFVWDERTGEMHENRALAYPYQIVE